MYSCLSKFVSDLSNLPVYQSLTMFFIFQSTSIAKPKMSTFIQKVNDAFAVIEKLLKTPHSEASDEFGEHFPPAVQDILHFYVRIKGPADDSQSKTSKRKLAAVKNRQVADNIVGLQHSLVGGEMKRSSTFLANQKSGSINVIRGNHNTVESAEASAEMKKGNKTSSNGDSATKKARKARVSNGNDAISLINDNSGFKNSAANAMEKIAESIGNKDGGAEMIALKERQVLVQEEIQSSIKKEKEGKLQLDREKFDHSRVATLEKQKMMKVKLGAELCEKKIIILREEKKDAEEKLEQAIVAKKPVEIITMYRERYEKFDAMIMKEINCMGIDGI